jgi:hypothetical protein
MPGARRAHTRAGLKAAQARGSNLVRSSGFASEPQERSGRVIIGVTTVSIVAIAAVVIVALIALMYGVPRGGRQRRPKL